MKGISKKIICVLLTIVMLIGVIPAAYAATPFKDVPQNAWYASYVDYAYHHDLMKGTSATTFEPDATMSRAMLATVIYRMAGRPSYENKSPFTDIKDTWYTDAVHWCYENSIAIGTSETTFEPNHNVTREQMVVIMRRFAEYKGLDVSDHTSLANYSDSRDISHYAIRSFAWAIAVGIIKGTTPTTLDPADNATRAQCAVVLQRFNEWLDVAKPAPVDPEPTDPEPTDPEPTDPEPHVHNWVKHHFDEVGHEEEKFVCTVCDWSCTESDAAAAGMNIGQYWTIYHQDIEDQKDPSVQHSYDGEIIWVVDKPAYDIWECECGAVSETEPVNP